MTPQSKAEAMLGAATFAWGSTFAIVKLAMEDVSPVLLIAIRFALSTALVLLLFRKRIFPIPFSAVQKGSLLGLFLFLGFVTQNIGLTITTASKSAFITGMMVVVVPMLQFVIERRAPKVGNIIGVAVVAVGLWLLTSPEGSSFNAGDALTLVCAVVFAIYIVYLDVISKEMTTLQLLFLQSASLTVYSALAVAALETPVLVPTSQLALTTLYLTLIATLLTMWVQTRYQKDTTPTRAVVIFSVEPVIASIIAYFLLGEVMGSLGVLGGGLILAGVLFSELSDKIPGLNRTLPGGES